MGCLRSATSLRHVLVAMSQDIQKTRIHPHADPGLLFSM